VGKGTKRSRPQPKKNNKKKRGPRPLPAAGGMSALLRPDFPLVSCLINANWEEAAMADILVARRTPLGISAVFFLVDLTGLGLKDAAPRLRLTPSDLSELLQLGSRHWDWEECSLELAQELVYGGIAWARQHGIRTPPAALAPLPILPPPATPPDLRHFGGPGGRPILVGTPSDIARFIGPDARPADGPEARPEPEG
jgi:hypothetical protein